MHVVFDEAHGRHAPKRYFRDGDFIPHPESPDRAEAILAALRANGLPVHAAEDHGPGPRAAVHTPEYLRFLETIHGRWLETGSPSDEVIPNIHPGRHMSSMPKGVIGQVGYFTADMSSPIGPDTWPAACAAADVAATAADAVLAGRDAAYALCRPPGHHAFADMTGGFCFLNNAAIAAQHAAARGRRPAVLDVDVHAGNGTQGIFWRRGDVLTVSLHCDPVDFYPHYAGYAHERGEGEGTGAHLNLPLPRGTGDNAYLEALAEGLAAIGAFAADFLVLSLGVDGYEADPLSGFRLTTGGFGRIARAIGELGLPTVIVQEGGYNVADLGANVTAFLEGFEAGRGGVL